MLYGTVMNKSDISRALPVRFSNLKHFAKSPAHYFEAITQERADSGPLRIGRGVHAMVLGGDYAAFKGAGDRRGKEFKAFEAATKCETILSKAEFYQCKEIADAVMNDQSARETLCQGYNEVKIDGVIGRREICGTVDAFDLNDLVLADLKTTATADPDAFSRLAISYGYVNQLAWYRMLIKMKYNVEMRTFRLVAVEKTAPYCVTVLNIPLDMIEDADKVNRTWFERLIECEESGIFPGYTNGRVIELTRPKPNFSILTDELESEAA